MGGWDRPPALPAWFLTFELIQIPPSDFTIPVPTFPVGPMGIVDLEGRTSRSDALAVLADEVIGTLPLPIMPLPSDQQKKRPPPGKVGKVVPTLAAVAAAAETMANLPEPPKRKVKAPPLVDITHEQWPAPPFTTKEELMAFSAEQLFEITGWRGSSSCMGAFEAMEVITLAFFRMHDTLRLTGALQWFSVPRPPFLLRHVVRAGTPKEARPTQAQVDQAIMTWNKTLSRGGTHFGGKVPKELLDSVCLEESSLTKLFSHRAWAEKLKKNPDHWKTYPKEMPSPGPRKAKTRSEGQIAYVMRNLEDFLSRSVHRNAKVLHDLITDEEFTTSVLYKVQDKLTAALRTAKRNQELEHKQGRQVRQKSRKPDEQLGEGGAGSGSCSDGSNGIEENGSGSVGGGGLLTAAIPAAGPAAAAASSASPNAAHAAVPVARSPTTTPSTLGPFPSTTMAVASPKPSLPPVPLPPGDWGGQARGLAAEMLVDLAWSSAGLADPLACLEEGPVD